MAVVVAVERESRVIHKNAKAAPFINTRKPCDLETREPRYSYRNAGAAPSKTVDKRVVLKTKQNRKQSKTKQGCTETGIGKSEPKKPSKNPCSSYVQVSLRVICQVKEEPFLYKLDVN